MKFLIFGAQGQVGSAVASEARAKGHEVTALPRAELDITDEKAVREAVERYAPTHIINAAAYNQVDQAEDDSEKAFSVNALGPGHIALAAKRNDCILVHYSTDYVFDGETSTAYTEEDRPNPLSAYARSKYLGELAAAINPKSYIIRTAWVFSRGGTSFVSRLLNLARSGKPLKFVNDQWCTPTYADDIAASTFAVIEQNAPFGLYHAAGADVLTPYEWATAILSRSGQKADITAVSSREFRTKALRPRRSVITNPRLKTLNIEIPGGLARLEECLKGSEEG